MHRYMIVHTLKQIRSASQYGANGNAHVGDLTRICPIDFNSELTVFSATTPGLNSPQSCENKICHKSNVLDHWAWTKFTSNRW